jgi:hypothetical protein
MLKVSSTSGPRMSRILDRHSLAIVDVRRILTCPVSWCVGCSMEVTYVGKTPLQWAIQLQSTHPGVPGHAQVALVLKQFGEGREAGH